MTYPSFSVGETLRSADMNAVGMWLVKASTFSTASTCPMTNVFSSSYHNYKIYVSLTGSAANNHNLIFYTGTNTEYTSLTIVRYGWYYSTAGNFTNFYQTGLNTVFVNNQSSTAANISTSELTVFSPNRSTVRTNVNVNSMDASSGLVIFNQNIVDATTAFTGFVIKPGSGTLTGEIRVYGMKD